MTLCSLSPKNEEFELPDDKKKQKMKFLENHIQKLLDIYQSLNK